MSEVQERSSTTVVTSENLAEFAAKKLGLNTEPPAAVPTEPVEASEPTEVLESDPAEPVEERKQNPKIERRFSEITKQREAARQEAERERQARLELENKVKELEGKLSPPPQEPTEADPKPKPEQFSDMFEYAEALSEWTADKRIREEKAKEAAQRAEQERQKTMDTWSNRVNDFRSKTPDFDDMVGSADVVVSNEVRDAIFDSDVGPQILYHLAENPDVAKKLQGMTAIGALRMIGKLEAKFEEPAQPQTQRETAVKTSKAPPPINPIRATAGGPVTDLDANRQFHGSYQSWKAARLAGRIR
jgi:hypothetical protein